MEIVINVLSEALDKNISYAVLMCIILFFLYLANILLGCILGTMADGFNLKKFIFGIVKALCMLFIVVGVCYILNVFTLTINLIEGININTEIVSTLELLTILITITLDTAKEVLDKIKAFRDLKYISYDDVVVSDTNIE